MKERSYDLNILEQCIQLGLTSVSVGEVRRRRRQLQRKWAVRNPARRSNWIENYLDYLQAYGYLTGEGQ